MDEITIATALGRGSPIHCELEKIRTELEAIRMLVAAIVIDRREQQNEDKESTQ